MSDFISQQITVSDKAPAKENFGIPLLVGFHTAWADRVREYSEADEMLDDGFTADDDLYKKAVVAKSQGLAPATFKVGRLSAATYTHTVTLTPTNVTAGFRYVGDVDDVSIDFEVQPSDTVADICDDLVTDITAGSNSAVADNATHVTVTASNPGVIIPFRNLTEFLTVEDTTTFNATDFNADMAEINDEDPDWYGFALAVNSADAVLAGAAWAEANKRMYFPQLSDTEVTDAGVTDDVASQLVALAYTYTAWIWHKDIGGNQWANVAWMCANLIPDPGSYTPAFKTLAGITAHKLRTGQKTAIRAKNGTRYTPEHKVNVTFEGKTPSGRFADVTRFVDWQGAEIEADLFTILINNPKVPYTNTGLSATKGTIEQSIGKGVTAGGVAAGSILVTVPRVEDTDVADRANRVLRNIEYSYRLTGALHSFIIKGKVTV